MSFVTQLDLSLADKLKEGLQAQGFEIVQPPYTIFQGKKKGVTCTLYSSGKLMVQGKEMAAFIQFYLEPEILNTFTFNYKHLDLDLNARIGVDESGKGDFFGPLCIAGVYAEGEEIQKLVEIGVKDSKKLQDASILKIAQKIKKDYVYHIVRIGPEKYNSLYDQFDNLNLLLAWGHATVIDHLIDKTGCENIIIDKFAAEDVVERALQKKKQKVILTQRTKAEQDAVVAAASILARSAFLEGLEQLSAKWEMLFSKGAGEQTLKCGKLFLQKHNSQDLRYVAKMHFKTAQYILEIS